MRVQFSILIYSMLLIFWPVILSGQHKLSPGDYTDPVSIPIFLSGTFGEIRSNHFHSGIDIKTKGRIGEKVYSIADGDVSRIKISPYGYGKALYIDHPDGHTSVYAHLAGFNDTIADYIRSEQYRLKSFEVDLYPEAGRLPVKKGEQIAISGATGSVGGPHLHFEIRETASQHTCNPQLLGIEVKDWIRPKIEGLRIYPENLNTRVDGKNNIKTFPTEGWGESYRLKGYDTVEIAGAVSFAVRTWDLLNDSDNRNGVYSVQLFIDEKEVYGHSLDCFSFNETRYLNSLIDYEDYKRNNRTYQRTHIAPNNKLSIYTNKTNSGVFEFSGPGFHQVKYVVKDAKGNTSVLTFVVKSLAMGPIQRQESNVGPDWFAYNRANTFTGTDIKFEAPEDAFYDSFSFTYESKPGPKGSFSQLHQVHNRFTPIHAYCNLMIRADQVPERLRSKALLARVDDKGARTAVSANYEEGWVVARIREFGNYCIVADTIPPILRPVIPGSSVTMDGITKLRFTIRDEFSGIHEYEGTLNGEWILMEYDPNNDLLFYTPDQYLRKGQNEFKLKVSDGKGNFSTYSAILIF